MAVRVLRLGTRRLTGEGTRIGTVRRPPRGVARADFARQDWYDVWLPVLAPGDATMKLGRAAESDRQWAAFRRRYLSEMRAPAAAQALDLLASLSHHSNFSIGCYCQDESRCHRSLLRTLLAERGANIEP